MLPYFRRNVTLLSVFIFTIFILTVGCNQIYRIGGDDDNSAAHTVIRGNVVSTLSIVPASIRADSGPKLPVAGADVFIESMPHLTVKSNENGEFLIGPVPPGNYRVIARIRSQDNKTYKEISSFVDAAPVNDNNAGELELKEATLKAKGKLTDPDGLPLVGVTVRIWGEDIITDENGMFESPLMPPGATAEFKIISGGYQNID
ncbi:MAG: carboxypeptidase regulatory-like domain-containing protein, partial [Erysipelotrichia bacterium]|nr:carboxypeptidase regulatory-like domain-containing protein [Erysipelotrichia bacterium]